MKPLRYLMPTLLLCLASASVWAQKTAADGIAEYRAMLADGNPSDLFEAKGEGLWKQARGPKNASLEKCDLGKGPGVVKGAFVELPRYFADTQKVQDMESRLLTCMETLQGFKAADIANTAFGRGEQNNLTALSAYISAESRGMKFNLPNNTVAEKTMYEVGKRLFFARGGTHDFSCSSCHGEDGKRIPAHFIETLIVRCKDKVIFDAYLGIAVSENPYIEFNFKGAEPGDLIEATWVDNLKDTRTDSAAVK